MSNRSPYPFRASKLARCRIQRGTRGMALALVAACFTFTLEPETGHLVDASHDARICPNDDASLWTIHVPSLDPKSHARMSETQFHHAEWAVEHLARHWAPITAKPLSASHK